MPESSKAEFGVIGAKLTLLGYTKALAFAKNMPERRISQQGNDPKHILKPLKEPFGEIRSFYREPACLQPRPWLDRRCIAHISGGEVRDVA